MKRNIAISNLRKMAKSLKKYYTYIVECSDGTFYTGYTTDIKKRIDKHNQGKGAKYTRGRVPVVLKYFEEYRSKSKAMQREYEIKQLSRMEKEQLILVDNN